MACFLSLKLNFEQLFVDRVIASLSHPRNGAHGARMQHNPMVDNRVFQHFAVNVAARDMIADSKIDWRKCPFFVAAQSRCVDAARDVNALGQLIDSLSNN